MLMLNKLMKYSVALLACFLLVACQSTRRVGSTQQSATAAGMVAGGAAGGMLVGGPLAPVGAAVGGAYGGVMAYGLTGGKTLEQTLQKQGVNVIRVGDTLVLVLPSDKFFYVGSPSLEQSYYPLLDQIAEYLSGHTVTLVQVAGYEDSTGSKTRDRVLSELRAKNVADYLWRKGVDARLLVAQGHGADNPIAAGTTKRGRMANNRIEISARVYDAGDKGNRRLTS